MTNTEFANETLTNSESQFSDYLHTNHPALMQEALKEFHKSTKRYKGDIYGYTYKQYFNFNKDIYTLARYFEFLYAELNGITSPEDNVVLIEK